MRWRGRKQSENVVDQRGRPGRRRMGPRMPGRRASLGGGCLGLLLLLAFIFLGGDPAIFLQQAGPGGGQAGGGVQIEAPAEQEGFGGIQNTANDPLMEFAGVVLNDTEVVWTSLFDQLGAAYEKPKLRVFEGSIDSACGFATAAVGPFYCPADQDVYLDFQFFRQLQSELGAPGDFAMAYVIAHEVAHHVQNQLGTMSQVHRRQKRVSETESNRLSVRLELQADFLAGVWAHHAQKMNQILEPGDIEEALRAANSIGDDRLQKSSRGYVVPDSFTHGTSAQRLKWFGLGFETGDLRRMEQLFELPYESL